MGGFVLVWTNRGPLHTAHLPPTQCQPLPQTGLHPTLRNASCFFLAPKIVLGLAACSRLQVVKYLSMAVAGTSCGDAFHRADTRLELREFESPHGLTLSSSRARDTVAGTDARPGRRGNGYQAPSTGAVQRQAIGVGNRTLVDATFAPRVQSAGGSLQMRPSRHDDRLPAWTVPKPEGIHPAMTFHRQVTGLRARTPLAQEAQPAPHRQQYRADYRVDREAPSWSCSGTRSTLTT
jgi:hypothetical protein